jgi:nicotinate-nucleotide adenylyltransferase
MELENSQITVCQKKIAIYSGSFNPIHIGHKQLALYLIDNNLVDEVWFVISPCNPLKHQSQLLDEHIRLDMLMLALNDNPKIKVSDVEFTMPIPSFTIDTLRKLTAEFSQYCFSMLIGSDNALVFDQWKEYNQILNEFPVLVYPRKGFVFQEVAHKFPQMKLLPSPKYNVSSTEVRQLIKEKKDVTSMLHPSVYQFILENELYK